MRVKTMQLLGATVSRDGPGFYFLCLGFLILTIIGTLNLLRSPTGRAFVAIRDSETAARSMGVNVALYKVKSFAISAALQAGTSRRIRTAPWAAGSNYSAVMNASETDSRWRNAS